MAVLHYSLFYLIFLLNVDAILLNEWVATYNLKNLALVFGKS